MNLARQIAATKPKALFAALNSSGSASWGLQQTAQAEAAYREALALALREGDPDSLDLTKARKNLGMVLRYTSRYVEAKELTQQALATGEKVLGAEHPLALVLKGDLALTNHRLGLYAEAQRMLEEVMAVQRRKLGESNPAVAGTGINLGNLLLDSGDTDGAERVLSESVAIFEKKYGRDYQGVRQALGTLAATHTAQGKLDLAQAELAEAIENEKRSGSVDDMDMYRLGEVRRLQGKVAEALELQRSALGGLQKVYGENNRFTANAHNYLALSLRDSGDRAGAEHELRAALAGYAGAEPQFIAMVKGELGALLLARGETHEEGLHLLGEAVQLREKFLGPDNPLTQRAREALRKAQGPMKS